MVNSLLSAGDIAPDCILPGVDGKDTDLRSDRIAGNPVVLVFCPQKSSATTDLLESFSRRLEAFRASGAQVFSIMRRKAEGNDPEQLGFPILFDSRDQAFQNFHVRQDRPTTIVLRRNHHIAGVMDGVPETQVASALSLVQAMARELKTELMHLHPPVLLIPEAFSRDDCTRLISIFESRGQKFMPPGAAIDHLGGADYKMRIPEHMREDRIDHFFFEKGTVALLTNRLNRIVPEILKAFQYRVTKYEALRMACYQGHRGGHSYGHRDNIPPYLYRRFAMSINLNTEDFEGGELRFPEFGDQRYRPETGTAIVFSSSLLHEAMHVTAGRRFVFLAFLFGEH
jgi:peroxiredoxin